jgi:hypothetical protein
MADPSTILYDRLAPMGGLGLPVMGLSGSAAPLRPTDAARCARLGRVFSISPTGPNPKCLLRLRLSSLATDVQPTVLPSPYLPSQ